jgi:hypothetical protein
MKLIKIDFRHRSTILINNLKKISNVSKNHRHSNINLFNIFKIGHDYLVTRHLNCWIWSATKILPIVLDAEGLPSAFEISIVITFPADILRSSILETEF